MTRKRFVVRIVGAVALLILGGLVLFSALDIILSNDVLTVAEYDVESPKINDTITIVQLSDLHNYSFGYENQDLVALVAAQQPHLIAVTGDMIVTTQNDVQTAVTLCKKLVEIAPVYYSLGNHETDNFALFGDTLTQQLADCGVIVLEREYVDAEINGNAIRIGGVSGYPYTGEYRDFDTIEFMQSFDAADCFKLLLAHQPEGMVCWGGMEKYDIDLTLSGHTHGGQVKIPLIGVLYAPDQGRFPKYVEGIFYKGGDTLIINRGLGSSGIVPRFNNPSEIVVVKLSNCG